jgi:TolB protein
MRRTTLLFATLLFALLGSVAFAQAAASAGSRGIVCGGTMEQPGIYAMRDDGSGRRRVLDDGWSPALSPEGNRIAFSMTRRGSTDIYVMKANGTHVRRITHDWKPHASSAPAWSPDGERIAFQSNRRLRGLGSWDTWIVTLATGELERFTNSKALDVAPDWSPDGTRIAFASERGWAPDSEGNWDVYIKDVATGEVTRFTRSLAIDGDPSWSPDGSAIAFESDRQGAARSRIWMKELDGGPTQLTRGGKRGDGESDWSPDGTRIVFVRGGNLRVLELGVGTMEIASATRRRVYASPSWRAA